LNHAFLRPYLWELPVKSILPLSIELFVYQALIVLMVLFKKRDRPTDQKQFLFFAIFFTISIFLIIGYIVPNLGSLVRYRSLYYPLLITPALCFINWELILGDFQIKNKNM